ncbi:hypothetical protein BDN72DRAFT_883662 [Pluteus cervinus]|uniref:Uncharacterized protein n=1 Tax=Pluteus cervinus TaxID=181527 RepID=A0ACD3A4G9_9AGAR|nr:hypothetical protein BDN72DRAFT_883662 [Pluteus cervinus]
MRALGTQAKIDEASPALEQHIPHIGQLPAEILVLIFQCHQLDLVDHANSEKIVQWTRLTFVCRRWESIAFNSKALWTIIPTHHTAYARFASQRSDPLLVSVIGTTWGEEYGITEEKRILFLSLLQRTRKVEVTNQPLQFYAETLENPPSELRFLEDVHFNNLQTPFQESPFPKSLRRLTLVSSRFEWDWLNLDHLTELRLISNPISITVSSFVGYLSQMPRLSSLEISYIFDFDEEDADQESPRHKYSKSATLISLQELLVKDSASFILEFLSYVHFKKHFTLRIELDLDTLDDGVELFSTLDRHLQASGHTIQGIDLDYGGGSWIGSPTTLSCFDQSSQNSPFLCIHQQSHPGH